MLKIIAKSQLVASDDIEILLSFPAHREGN